MFQNAALVQHLSDAKMAEIRRTAPEPDHRTDQHRHDLAFRIARPLRVKRNQLV